MSLHGALSNKVYFQAGFVEFCLCVARFGLDLLACAERLAIDLREGCVPPRELRRSRDIFLDFLRFWVVLFDFLDEDEGVRVLVEVYTVRGPAVL